MYKLSRFPVAVESSGQSQTRQVVQAGNREIVQAKRINNNEQRKDMGEGGNAWGIAFYNSILGRSNMDYRYNFLGARY